MFELDAPHADRVAVFEPESDLSELGDLLEVETLYVGLFRPLKVDLIFANIRHTPESQPAQRGLLLRHNRSQLVLLQERYEILLLLLQERLDALLGELSSLVGLL